MGSSRPSLRAFIWARQWGPSSVLCTGKIFHCLSVSETARYPAMTVCLTVPGYKCPPFWFFRCCSFWASVAKTWPSFHSSIKSTAWDIVAIILPSLALGIPSYWTFLPGTAAALSALAIPLTTFWSFTCFVAQLSSILHDHFVSPGNPRLINLSSEQRKRKTRGCSELNVERAYLNCSARL